MNTQSASASPKGSDRHRSASIRSRPRSFKGRWRTTRSRWGINLMRMGCSSVIGQTEELGAALTDAAGGQLCECKMSTPLQSGPIPGYVRGILKSAGQARGLRSGRATSSCTTIPTAAAPWARRGLLVPIFQGGRVDRIFDDHRAPSGHRRVDAGKLRHRRRRRYVSPKACNSRRSKCSTEAGATTRSGTCCATTFARPTSSSATWRRRSRPPRSALAAISRWSKNTA